MQIPIFQINVNTGRREVDQDAVQKLADSIFKVGLLNPITVDQEYNLIAGLHRLEAAKRLGWTEIKCTVSNLSGLLAELAEIDENLVRRDFDCVDEGEQLARRKEIYEIIHKPAEEWIRIENAHEPIIQKRDFDLVQKISSLDTRTAPDGEAVYLFSGLLVCGCCGARMTRKTNTVKGKKYIYYHCPTGKKKGCAHPVMLKEADLIDCVLASLQAHIRHVVSLDELLDSISEEQINQEEIAKLKAQIADNEVKLEEARQFKATLYENFISNLISKKDYQDLKNLYTGRAEQAQEAIGRLRAEMELVTNNSSSRLRWTQHFKEFSAMTTLDRRAVIAMVQSIRVEGKNDLVITFRYMIEYVKVLKRLDQMEKLPPDLRDVLDTLVAAEKEAA